MKLEEQIGGEVANLSDHPLIPLLRDEVRQDADFRGIDGLIGSRYRHLIQAGKPFGPPGPEAIPLRLQPLPIYPDFQMVGGEPGNSQGIVGAFGGVGVQIVRAGGEVQRTAASASATH